MKLQAPTNSIDFTVTDMHGESFSLNDFRGKAVVLSFFRDASCPFCLKRVFDLSIHQQRWRKSGVEVIAVFSSTANELANFHKDKFERFRVVPDPELNLYQKYGIETSFPGFIKGLLFKVPTIVEGFKKGAKVDKNNPNGLILPADFLIDANGLIVKSWYGRNAADNIPMKYIQRFVQDHAQRGLKQDLDL